MNLLVCPHELAMGGSQMLALELAAAAQRGGHGVVVYSTPGVLVERVRELGLTWIEAPVGGAVFSPKRLRALDRLVAEHRIDVVHAYEWRPSVQAAAGPSRRGRVPTVMTIMSMDVPDFLPSHLPIIVGTHELALAQRAHQDVVHLLEPPIDTEENRVVDIAAAREAWGIGPDELVLSIVCRMSTDLDKAQGVLAAIHATGTLAAERAVRLLVVGDGPELAEVRAAAELVNSSAGRPVVVVAGNRSDPRSAYEAADIVLGMGTSALKGLAFSKPLVVQGEAGFWKLLDESTESEFLSQGWFGHGGAGVEALLAAIRSIADDAPRRAELGALGRSIAVERFSLDRAAAAMLEISRDAIARPPAARRRRASLRRMVFEVLKFRTVMNGRAALARLRTRRGTR